ncbi:MAG: hypothetical protein PHO26_08460 [Dehalococcoidia bacterium]|nr:hypothetical protein [Dehalococcoidia bacterium]MDD5495065.1 hypothetical protein [Dehalococcoidia bacterium]
MRLIYLTLVTLIVVSSGCILSSPPETTSPPETSSCPVEAGVIPNIQLFSASQNAIAPGGTIVLNWQVADADSISIDNGIGNVQSKGNISIKPATTMTYTLTAVNIYGNSTSTASIKVTPDPYPAPQEPGTLPAIPGWYPPVIKSFYAFRLGEQSVIVWDVSPTFRISIDPSIGDVAPSGNITVPSKACLYVLTATAGDGSISRRTTSVSGGSRYAWAKGAEKPVWPEIERPSGGKNMAGGPVGGFEILYNLNTRASYATWITGAGLLDYAKNADSINGSAFSNNYCRLEDGKMYDYVLHTYPQQITNGVVYGYYIETYNALCFAGGVGGFESKIGFENGNKGARARFRLILRREGMDPITMIDVTKEYDGKLNDVFQPFLPYMPLRLGGKYSDSADIYLRVDNVGPTKEIRPVWVDPKITDIW